MTSPNAQPRARRPRRDPRRERNRKNLVSSALRLVASEGSVLTVARVTRQAGMDPAGFYAHFKNIAECEQAVAEEFRGYVESHTRAYERVRAAADVETAIEANEALLSSWLSTPDWITLLARCRYDDSPLGQSVRDLLAAVRRDYCEALWDEATRRGVRGRHLRDIEALAELCVGLFETSLGRLCERREADVRREAERLVEATWTLKTATFQRLLEADSSDPSA